MLIFFFEFLQSIGLNELVSRSCKRVFKQYIQSVTSLNLSSAIALFLNCYLSSNVKSSQQSTSPAVSSASSTTNNTSNTTTVPTESSTNSNENDQSSGKGLSNKKRKKNQKRNNRSVQGETYIYIKKLVLAFTDKYE